MSFGKNPFVAKAELAEQKAVDAKDDYAREQAYRDAANCWERAAAREQPGKKRKEYEERAELNRARADGDVPKDEADAGDEAAAPPKGSLLN